MNQPAGLLSVSTATASVPRPSQYPGFQSSWYSLGINLQTHAPDFCFPPFPSIPLLSSESDPCESPGPDLTGHSVHLGALSSHAFQSERGGEGQVWMGRQAEARRGQARRGRRLAGVQVARVPWRQLSAEAALTGQAGVPRGPSGGRAQRGSLALAGSEARGPPDPAGPGARASGPGSRRAHSCHQSGQADPLPSGRMTPVIRPAGDPPSPMNSLSISVPVLRVFSFPEPETHPAHSPSQQLSTPATVLPASLGSLAQV